MKRRVLSTAIDMPAFSVIITKCGSRKENILKSCLGQLMCKKIADSVYIGQKNVIMNLSDIVEMRWQLERSSRIDCNADAQRPHR